MTPVLPFGVVGIYCPDPEPSSYSPKFKIYVEILESPFLCLDILDNKDSIFGIFLHKYYRTSNSVRLCSKSLIMGLGLDMLRVQR